MMNASIKMNVPEWQIGQEVTVYFRDTMMQKGICEAEEPPIIHCKECKYYNARFVECNRGNVAHVTPDWYCADGERS